MFDLERAIEENTKAILPEVEEEALHRLDWAKGICILNSELIE